LILKVDSSKFKSKMQEQSSSGNRLSPSYSNGESKVPILYQFNLINRSNQC
jgi:hypothetical protein